METKTDTQQPQQQPTAPPAAGTLSSESLSPPQVRRDSDWQAALSQLPPNAGIL